MIFKSSCEITEFMDSPLWPSPFRLVERGDITVKKRLLVQQSLLKGGGEYRIRTGGLLHAMQAL
jgi:hypothetical protein